MKTGVSDFSQKSAGEKAFIPPNSPALGQGQKECSEPPRASGTGSISTWG